MANPFQDLIPAKPAAKDGDNPFAHLIPKSSEPMIDGQEGGDASAAVGANTIDGIPILGPLFMGGVDRLVAGARSIGLGGQEARPYEDELKHVQEWRKGTLKNHPTAATAGHVLGGVTGALPMIALAPEAFGIDQGVSTGVNAVRGALGGAAMNGTDAAVRSGGDMKEIGKGGAWGVIGGALGPYISAGMGKVADATMGIDDALSGLMPAARKYAMDTLGQAGAKPTQEALERLGPMGTLADVSPEWMGVARGAAMLPGMRDEIVNPLLQRARGAVGRLTGATNEALGEARPPNHIHNEIDEGFDTLSPRYNEVFDRHGRAVDPQPTVDYLDAQIIDHRGAAQQRLQEVRDSLYLQDQNGNPVRGPDGNLVVDPNPRTLQRARRALDGVMKTQAVREDATVSRALTQARERITAELQRQVPGISDLDAQWRELSRQGEAVDAGQTLLDNDRANVVWPQEMPDRIQQGIETQGDLQGPSGAAFRDRQGMRSEVGRRVGTMANDAAALRSSLQGEGGFNTDKLAAYYGPERTGRLVDAVANETTMQNTTNRVAGGSDTELGRRFANKIDEMREGAKIPTDTTLTGAGSRGLQKLINSIMGRNAEQKAMRFGRELGRHSIMTGPERDAFLAAMEARNGDIGGLSPGVQQVISALTVGR